jgi:uncharacterized protein (DUF697 family)
MAMYETETETGFEMGESGEFHEYGEFQETESEHGEYGEYEFERLISPILGTAMSGAGGSPLSEAQEMELAAELLEISSEEELEQFLGGLIKKVGGFVRSPIGRALGGVLKSVAKKALPIVGGAIGSFVAPGVGTAIGSKLGSMASGLFELELEMMSAEQAEFEVARRVVGLAAHSARTAAMARPRHGVSPHTVARAAVAQAARMYAPGLSRSMMQTLRASRGGRPMPQGRANGGATSSANRSRRFGPRPYGPRPGFGGGYYSSVVAQPGMAPQADAGTNGQDDGAPWDFDGDAGDSDGYGSPSTSGRWVRRGRKIILLGV